MQQKRNFRDGYEKMFSLLVKQQSSALAGQADSPNSEHKRGSIALNVLEYQHLRGTCCSDLIAVCNNPTELLISKSSPLKSLSMFGLRFRIATSFVVVHDPIWPYSPFVQLRDRDTHD